MMLMCASAVFKEGAHEVVEILQADLQVPKSHQVSVAAFPKLEAADQPKTNLLDAGAQ